MTAILGFMPALPEENQLLGGLANFDPKDFTKKFNTELSEEESAKYQAWLEQLSVSNNRNVAADEYDYDLRGAWKAGAKQVENGHFPDEYKKPNHPTFSSDSIYSGADGNVGGNWTKTKSGWAFSPSEYQLKIWKPDELQRYFQEREPDAALVLP